MGKKLAEGCSCNDNNSPKIFKDFIISLHLFSAIYFPMAATEMMPYTEIFTACTFHYFSFHNMYIS